VLAKNLPDFTTDDMLAEMGEAYYQIREPRLLGAVVRAAAQAKRIVGTGQWRVTTRPGNHARPLRVWRAVKA
jgi:hypothetical protein